MPVHLVNGVWDTLALGLFATDNGLFATGQFGQLIAQVVGVVACGVWSAGTALLLFSAIKATVGLRVTPTEEAEGLDISEHGAVAYPEELPVAGPREAPADAITSPSAS